MQEYTSTSVDIYFWIVYFLLQTFIRLNMKMSVYTRIIFKVKFNSQKIDFKIIDNPQNSFERKIKFGLCLTP